VSQGCCVFGRQDPSLLASPIACYFSLSPDRGPLCSPCNHRFFPTDAFILESGALHQPPVFFRSPAQSPLLSVQRNSMSVSPLISQTMIDNGLLKRFSVFSEVLVHFPLPSRPPPPSMTRTGQKDGSPLTRRHFYGGATKGHPSLFFQRPDGDVIVVLASFNRELPPF